MAILKLSKSNVSGAPEVILKTAIGVPLVISASLVEYDDAFPIGIKSNLEVEYVGLM